MSTPKNHPDHGFTLIELLLYISIVGGLLIAVSMFFATTVEARIKAQSIAEVDQQGMLAMDYMLQTIRNADAVSLPVAGGAAANSLTLTTPPASLQVVFDLNGSVLQVKEGAAAAIPLINNKVAVTNLSFKNLTRSGTPGIVQVSFTLSRLNTTGSNQYDYQKIFTSSAALRHP